MPADYDLCVESIPFGIIDCHQHFFDAGVLRYPVFQRRSAALESFVGNYSELPRRYCPEDYLKDTKGFNVVKTVWAEFISDSPVNEVRWAESLSTGGGLPSGMIALADFMSPDTERLVDEYGSIDRVRAVRQHLAWHPSNPLLRSASGPQILSDPGLRRGVALLRNYKLCCEIEVFAPQLPDFASLANSCPDLQFVLPVMGWPLDVGETGFQTWRRDMAFLSSCENVSVKIFGMECIFGVEWTFEHVRPWILETIACFGPSRCMFASHMPLTLLACSFGELYSAYLNVISDFSLTEKRQLLHDTAARVYRL